MSTVRFTLDGREITAPAGASLLTIARRQGASVPTLCHLAEGAPMGACLVCLVRDASTGRMLPACATAPQPGQRIETGGEAVLAARRRSVELLLSEHAGDCAAPCVRACPHGIDIPEILRWLAGEGPLEGRVAAELAAHCAGCAAPCQLACRRGRHDAPLAIRALLARLHQGGSLPEASAPAPSPRFDARLGPLREGELAEHLRGASPAPSVLPAEPDHHDSGEAAAEARRCLRCDCRAKDACRLRDVAEATGAQQRHFSGRQRTPFGRPDAGPLLSVEPGKCIRCGRCVALSAEGDGPRLCFLGRGLELRVAPPPGHGLREILEPRAAAFAAACPTGAISLRRGAGEGDA